MKSNYPQEFIPGNHSNVKKINRCVILNIIRQKQPISRIEISRLTGLTKSTVSNIVAEIIEEELIQEISVGKSTGGRKPTLLKLASNGILAGVMAIHRERTAIAICNLDGNVVAKKIVATEKDNPEKFIDECGILLNEMLKGVPCRQFLGVGVSVPGLVRNEDGLILFVPRLGWKNVTARMILEKRFNAPVFVDNEANVEALAHLFYPRNEAPEQDFVQMSVGYGLGVGIVLNGDILRGRTTSSIEFGHTIIHKNGEACMCGNNGCLEAYTSDAAVVRTYNKFLAEQGQEHQDVAYRFNQVEASPIQNGIELSWKGEGDAVKYAIYRDESPDFLPRPQYRIATVSNAPFVDLAVAESCRYYYRIQPLNAFDEEADLSDPVSCVAPELTVIFDEKFSANALKKYTINASKRIDARRNKLVFSSGMQKDEDAIIYRSESFDNYIVSGVVRPVEIGSWDTIGILIKVQSGDEWYYAMLAYGMHLKERYNIAFMRRRMVAGQRDEIWLAFNPLEIDPQSEYNIKVGVFEDWLRMKAWKVGEVEPDNWQLSYKDDLQWKTGSVGLRHFGTAAEVSRFKLVPIHGDVFRSELAENTADSIKEFDRYYQNILLAAGKNDAIAVAALQKTARHIGVGIANIYNGLGVNTFYISGKITEVWDIVEPAIKEELQRSCFGNNTHSLKIFPLENTEDFELMGCCALVTRTLFMGFHIIRYI